MICVPNNYGNIQVVTYLLSDNDFNVTARILSMLQWDSDRRWELAIWHVYCACVFVVCKSCSMKPIVQQASRLPVSFICSIMKDARRDRSVQQRSSSILVWSLCWWSSVQVLPSTCTFQCAPLWTPESVHHNQWTWYSSLRASTKAGLLAHASPTHEPTHLHYQSVAHSLSHSPTHLLCKQKFSDVNIFGQRILSTFRTEIIFRRCAGTNLYKMMYMKRILLLCGTDQILGQTGCCTKSSEK